MNKETYTREIVTGREERAGEQGALKEIRSSCRTMFSAALSNRKSGERRR